MANAPSIVLVTGCSSGIGHATAHRLRAAGHTVYASARNPSALTALVAAGCRAVALDVTDEVSMQRAVETVLAEAGHIDVLVNNAGYSQSGALEEIPPARLRAQFETNVFGLLRLTQLVLPSMRARGRGRIVNLSSMGGELTFPGGGAYHASKHAVEALSDALRFEVRGFGIDVVVIQPGLIRTNFADAAVGTVTTATGPYSEFNQMVAKSTKQVYEEGPLAALAGSADDVARAVERAIRVRRPRARYRVTGSARLLLFLRSILPDAWWDAFLRSQFPEPRRSLPLPTG